MTVIKIVVIVVAVPFVVRWLRRPLPTKQVLRAVFISGKKWRAPHD